VYGLPGSLACYCPGGEVETMNGLTTKELGSIEECIKMEALCVQKLRGYEQEAADPELRDICRSALQTSERHVDELLELLR